MKTAIVILALLLQSPKPTPTPDWITKPYTGMTIATAPQWQIQIYTNPQPEGNVMSFKSPDGKTLEVRMDGTLKGDLPASDAAKAFWTELGKAYPYMCKPLTDAGVPKKEK